MTDETVDWSAFYAPLQKYVAHRVHSRADADDLVQLITAKGCR